MMSRSSRCTRLSSFPRGAGYPLLLVLAFALDVAVSGGCYTTGRTIQYDGYSSKPAPTPAAGNGAVAFGAQPAAEPEAALPAPAPKHGSIVVMPLVAKRVEQETVEILSEILVNTVNTMSDYNVIGPSDINAMLGKERMKEALGCDSMTCYAQIGGALDADLLIGGTVSRLGTRIITSLSMVDAKAQKVLRRGEAETENNEDLYRAAIEQAVRKLLGKPGR